VLALYISYHSHMLPEILEMGMQLVIVLRSNTYELEDCIRFMIKNAKRNIAILMSGRNTRVEISNSGGAACALTLGDRSTLDLSSGDETVMTIKYPKNRNEYLGDSITIAGAGADPTATCPDATTLTVARGDGQPMPIRTYKRVVVTEPVRGSAWPIAAFLRAHVAKGGTFTFPSEATDDDAADLAAILAFAGLQHTVSDDRTRVDGIRAVEIHTGANFYAERRMVTAEPAHFGRRFV
jgi:hypothetical protein